MITVKHDIFNVRTDPTNQWNSLIAVRGKSAYEVAVDNGYIGTEAEWLAQLSNETAQQVTQAAQDAATIASQQATSAINSAEVATSAADALVNAVVGAEATVIDKKLTLSGAAAEAKATGEKLQSLIKVNGEVISSLVDREDAGTALTINMEGDSDIEVPTYEEYQIIANKADALEHGTYEARKVLSRILLKDDIFNDIDEEVFHITVPTVGSTGLVGLRLYKSLDKSTKVTTASGSFLIQNVTNALNVYVQIGLQKTDTVEIDETSLVTFSLENIAVTTATLPIIVMVGSTAGLETEFNIIAFNLSLNGAAAITEFMGESDNISFTNANGTIEQTAWDYAGVARKDELEDAQFDIVQLQSKVTDLEVKGLSALEATENQVPTADGKGNWTWSNGGGTVKSVNGVLPDADGNITISTGGGGSGSGSGTTIDDETMQQIIDRLNNLEYTAIAINSFSCTPANVMLGSVQGSVKLAWSLSGTPTSLTLVSDGKTTTLDTTAVSRTLNNLGATDTKTWTLKAVDSKNATATKTVSLEFCNPLYYGAAAVPESYDRTFLDTLESQTLTNTKARTITVTAGSGQYIYYAYPARLGNATFTVGVLSGGFEKVATVSITNDYDYTESYYIYRSDQPNLGETTAKVE